MAKTHRIMQVDDDIPSRSPERIALAAAIEQHSAVKAALNENLVSQRRAEEAKFAAIRAVDEATKNLEIAKITDAESIAQGSKTSAVTRARTALQEAEDDLEAARAASTMLTEQQSALKNGLSDMRLRQAIVAAVCIDPAIRTLCEDFRAAQLRFHEMREAVVSLGNILPDVSNAAGWEQSGLPKHMRLWASFNWEHLPPSPIAEKVKLWIERLRTDADVELKLAE
jgi:hypothetical protein